jgi:hypothetical protein
MRIFQTTSLKHSFAISRRVSPEFCCLHPALFDQSNRGGSRPAIGRPQGWRWRAPAFGGCGLDPVRSLVCRLCTRSVEDRARWDAFGQLNA